MKTIVLVFQDGKVVTGAKFVLADYDKNITSTRNVLSYMSKPQMINYITNNPDTYIGIESGKQIKRVQLDENIIPHIYSSHFLSIKIFIGGVRRFNVFLSFYHGGQRIFYGEAVDVPILSDITLNVLKKLEQLRWENDKKPKISLWVLEADEITIEDVRAKEFSASTVLNSYFESTDSIHLSFFRSDSVDSYVLTFDFDIFMYSGEKITVSDWQDWRVNLIVTVDEFLETFFEKRLQMVFAPYRMRVLINDELLSNVYTHFYNIVQNSNRIHVTVIEYVQAFDDFEKAYVLRVAFPGERVKTFNGRLKIGIRTESTANIIVTILAQKNIFATIHTIVNKSIVRINSDHLKRDILVQSSSIIAKRYHNSKILDIDIIIDRSITNLEEARIDIQSERQHEYAERLLALADSQVTQSQNDLLNAVSRITNIVLEKVATDVGSHGSLASDAILDALRRKIVKTFSLRPILSKLFLTPWRAVFGTRNPAEQRISNDTKMRVMLRPLEYKQLLFSATTPGHALALVLEQDTGRLIVLDPGGSDGSEEQALDFANLLKPISFHSMQAPWRLCPTILSYQAYDVYMCGIGGGNCLSFSTYIILHYVIWNNIYNNKVYSFEDFYTRFEKVALFTKTPEALLRIIADAWPMFVHKVQDMYATAITKRMLMKAWMDKLPQVNSLEPKVAIRHILDAFKAAYYDLADGKELDFIADVVFLDTFIDFKLGFDQANEMGTRISIILQDLLSEEGVLGLNSDITSRAYELTCRYCQRLGLDMQCDTKTKDSFCNRECQKAFYYQ